MRKASKITQCKVCGQEMANSAKSCPHCGAKNKKPIYKKWWFWVIIIIIAICSIPSENEDTPKNDANSAPSVESTSGDTNTPEETNASDEAVPNEEAPDIELSTDFEREIYNIVKNHNGKLLSISTANPENSEEATVSAAILCENDENVVNEILAEASEAVKSSTTKVGTIFSFGDIEDGDEAPVMVIAGVSPDGTTAISFTSADYNSERNKWIRSQFSVWDGSHIELEKLIIRNLNDEESYKHIETTYRDIIDESARDEVNQVLSDSGYSQRVEVGDLFIQTVFSAKNGFGGTIKNTAFGIASYSNNTITLIDIG